MEEKLKEYDLHIVQSDKSDRCKVDFEIRDDYNTFCAEVWGDDASDMQIVCEHPAVEFDDDETVGECPICGATCNWHWDISADDGYVVKDRMVDYWDNPAEIGGIVGKYIKQLTKEN